MKLTDTQFRIINNLWWGVAPLDGAKGMSQHGGWHQALVSLQAKGLVFISEDNTYGLTDAGRQVRQNHMGNTGAA